MGRFLKAKADGPYPWDRVFPSNKELEEFGDELFEFLEWSQDVVEENEKLKAQLRSINLD